MTDKQKLRVRELLMKGFSEFQHGDCYGADEQAFAIAKHLGLRTVAHPPSDPRKRAFTDSDETRECKPYLQRNTDIVRDTDFLIATPKEPHEILRSGTWSTIRRAIKLGKLFEVIPPGDEQ